MFYAYKINNDGTLWIIEKEKKEEIPRWCALDADVKVVEKLPAKIIAMQTKAKQKEEIAEVGSKIRQHIYTEYDREKQNDDQMWESYGKTVIVGMSAKLGVQISTDELTVDVLDAVLAVESETLTVDEYVAPKPLELQEHYRKLLKIGLRMSWAKACKDEGISALTEGRDPNYPPFVI